MNRLRQSLFASIACLALTSTFAGPVATPAGGTSAHPNASADEAAISRRDTAIDDSGNYQQELQACLSGRSQQSRESCLEEARNARAAKRRGDLSNGSENYLANATARCRPLTGEFKAACEARVMGFGSVSGSVAGGGLLREVETVVLPPGADRVRIEAQTSNPVVLVPSDTK